MLKNLSMEISDLSILSKALYSNKPFIEKTKSFPSFNANQELISKEYKFRTKKKGRKKKISLNIENQSTRATDPYEIVHNKFSKDNIRRRIKALFNNYIIRLLNNLIKQKYLNSRHYFLKMNIKVTKDLGIEYNRNLLNTPLKEIIVNISNKYQNKENNNIKCIKFKVYGKEYLDKFIENTKNFIEYFKKGKNRKSRKPPEVDIINIPLEFNKNNIIEDNKIEKIMVESFAQTDLCGINSKLIAFY